jgi:hypothetical protein
MKKYRPDSNYNPKELTWGIKVEMEHTTNKEVAKKIAKDHLDEFPDYYTNLIKMERKLANKRYNQLVKAGYAHKEKEFGGVF